MEFKSIKIKKDSKRVGRGKGSNKGKTSGRGMNGQRSRSGANTKYLTGGQTKLYLRLPKVSKMKGSRKNRETVLSYDILLQKFTAQEEITKEKIEKLLNNKFPSLKFIRGKMKFQKRIAGSDIRFSKSLQEMNKDA